MAGTTKEKFDAAVEVIHTLPKNGEMLDLERVACGNNDRVGCFDGNISVNPTDGRQNI